MENRVDGRDDSDGDGKEGCEKGSPGRGCLRKQGVGLIQSFDEWCDFPLPPLFDGSSQGPGIECL